MTNPTNKAELLQRLREGRAEWDAALAEVQREIMDEPGVAGAWSVKDVVAHITSHERWIGDRMHEVLRGESYTPTPVDAMSVDDRNEVFYRQNKSQSVDEVLRDSQEAFRLIEEAVEAHTDAFLFEPLRFEGVPVPITVWTLLRGDVYEHYPQHIPQIREWLASRS